VDKWNRLWAGIFVLLVPCGRARAEERADASRWTEKQANDWYAEQPWLVGSNYIPATAINQLEMWQADSFDPQRIDLVLGWAESIGLNTMRVFLHNLLWQQDATGFQKRIDTFLSIAAKTPHADPVRTVRLRLGPQSSSWQATRSDRKNPDVSSMGFVGAAVHRSSAESVVPRNFPHRRDCVPGRRGLLHRAADG
jgi:hypothetical protein